MTSHGRRVNLFVSNEQQTQFYHGLLLLLTQPVFPYRFYIYSLLLFIFAHPPTPYLGIEEVLWG